MTVLAVDKLTVRFQGLVAVNEVCLAVGADQICSVIGPNGAGKTTVFNAITGIYEPSEGTVQFCGGATQRQLTKQTLLFFAGFGIVVALGLTVALNIQALWEAAITQNYLYRQPFPWGKAVRDAFDFLFGLSWEWGFAPLLIGALIGGAGAWSVWRQSRRRSDIVSSLGISRTFQNIRLFKNMTALENVLVGMDRAYRYRVWHAALRLPKFFKEEREAAKRAIEILEFVELKAEAERYAGQLSYGSQRRLEIARALASNPKLLLLDEPAAGMNPSEAQDLVELIRKIRDRGVAVLLIEHHMRVVMAISDRISVLDFGNKIAEGSPEEIRCNAAVIEAYLGPQQ